MVAAWLILGAVVGLLLGLWLMRMTRSDTWERVNRLEDRIERLEQK